MKTRRDSENDGRIAWLSRRRFLQHGLLGAAGLVAGRLGISPIPISFAASPRARPVSKARAVIQIWMWGGPSHLDTFDPKPDAGNDYTGPFNKPIATNVDGIQINELLPLLARQADKYSIIRSMTHGINGHETASYIAQTGRREARLSMCRRRGESVQGL